MTEHTWYKCTQPCHKPHCMFCEGGLGWCTACDGFEGSLPTHCPGRKIGESDQQLIYKSTLDFRDGQWVNRSLESWEQSREYDPSQSVEIDRAVLRLNQEMTT